MSGLARFQRLFEPGWIGKVKTRNRLIKSGAQCGLNNETEPHFLARLRRPSTKGWPKAARVS